jgi:RNA polymerase sigma-70 factor (ECF subfamily)
MTARDPLAIEANDDADVVAKIAQGDLQGLGTLFDRHERDVRRLLGRLGVTASDADDLLQATFLQVINAARGFDPQFSVRSWLFGIAAMMLRRHRRSASRLARRLATLATSFVRSEPETPGDAFDSEEAGHRMQMALDRLSPKRREAFVLVSIEGASGEEAAAALGIPLNTLWTRLHHARKDLRRWVLGEGH